MSDCNTTVILGAKGDTGAGGTNGINGISAISRLTAPFTMPAEGGNAAANVDDSRWLAPTQIVQLQNAGFMQVLAVPNSTLVTLINLKNTAGSRYLNNVAPGTVIAAGSDVVAGGPQGAAGVSPAGGASVTNPYVITTATAQLIGATNLGLLTTGLLKNSVVAGSATLSKALDGTDYLSPTTGLEPADIGVSVQGLNANLTSFAGLAGIADRLAYFTGPAALALATLTNYARTLLAATDAATARSVLGLSYGLLGSITGLDLNVGVTDTAFTIGATRYRIDKITVDLASVNTTTATLGIFTAAGGAGTTIAADQSLAALTAATKFHDLTLQAVTGTDMFASGTLYARVGTAQGVADLANLYLFGWRIA